MKSELAPYSLFHDCNPDESLPGRLITDEQRGEVLCETCGHVFREKMLEHGHEHSMSTLENYMNKTRAEGKTSMKMYDKGLYTKINKQNRDASGRRLSTQMKTKFNRLRLWDKRTIHTGPEKNFAKAFSLLDAIKSRLGLSESVTEAAAILYRKAVAKKIVRGRTISTMMASCVYATCKTLGVPRSADEVSNASNVSKKHLSKGYKALVNSLNLTVNPNKPTEFVRKIGSRVGAPEPVIRLAYKFSSKVEENGFPVGKKPMGIAAASVYLGCAINNENVTYEKLSKATHVSSVTIRKTTYKLFELLSDDPSIKHLIAK